MSIYILIFLLFSCSVELIPHKRYSQKAVPMNESYSTLQRHLSQPPLRCGGSVLSCAIMESQVYPQTQNLTTFSPTFFFECLQFSFLIC